MTALHQIRTHPTPVDGCFGCKAATLVFSPAIELRVQSDGNYRTQRTIGESERDMDAYRQLRREGLQPPHIAGSRKLLSTADHPLEVSRGRAYRGKRVRQFKEAVSILGDAGFNPSQAHTEPIDVDH